MGLTTVIACGEPGEPQAADNQVDDTADAGDGTQETQDTDDAELGPTELALAPGGLGGSGTSCSVSAQFCPSNVILGQYEYMKGCSINYRIRE